MNLISSKTSRILPGQNIKISLTNHVQERRAKGFIPPKTLREVATYLVKMLPEDAESKTYKFYNDQTVAVIRKNGNTYRFITFYGRTGYTMEVQDGNFGEFKITGSYDKTPKLMGTDNKNKIRYIRENTVVRFPTAVRNKLKKGTYFIQEIQEDSLPKVRFLLISKFNDKLVNMLGLDGHYICSVHENKIKFIDVEKLREGFKDE